MWLYCAAHECHILGKQFLPSGYEKSWYKFPVENEALMKEWRAALNYRDSWTLQDYQCICAKHFTSSDFEDSISTKRKLKPNAVPHIFSAEHRANHRVIQARSARMKGRRRGVELPSKNDLKKEVIINLERIDQVLNIPNGKMSGIVVDKKKLNAIFKSIKGSAISQKNVKPAMYKKKRILKARAENSDDFDRNMDLSAECMESLFTPETNLVEMTSVPMTIWGEKNATSAQKKLYVVRDQLPKKLRLITSNHLWIQDPTCKGQRMKVQVVDATTNLNWMPELPEEIDPIPPLVAIAPPRMYPAAVNTICEIQLSDVPTESVESSELATTTPQMSIPSSMTDQSILSSLLSQRSVEPVKQPVASVTSTFDACAFGMSHDHQYYGPAEPVTIPTCLAVQLKEEQAEHAETRKRISALENELAENRRQLSAARVLINRLRFTDLAKSAQIRVLQQAEHAHTQPLYNQVFEPPTYENFGQHFMAPCLPIQPSFKPERM